MTDSAAVTFPDVELWATGWLRTMLGTFAEAADVGVDNKVPNPRPDRLVALRRNGGTQLSPSMETARVSVRVFAPTDQAATNLTALVRGLFAGCAGTYGPVQIKRSQEVGGPADVPDDNSGAVLKLFAIELLVRGAPLANN